MKDYSNAFVFSQYEYYKSLIPCQGKREAGTIIGLFQQFQAEAKIRGLL